MAAKEYTENMIRDSVAGGAVNPRESLVNTHGVKSTGGETETEHPVFDRGTFAGESGVLEDSIR